MVKKSDNTHATAHLHLSLIEMLINQLVAAVAATAAATIAALVLVDQQKIEEKSIRSLSHTLAILISSISKNPNRLQSTYTSAKN